eukprot:365477-Chlamydomonas_euryale.AAC.9
MADHSCIATSLPANSNAFEPQMDCMPCAVALASPPHHAAVVRDLQCGKQHAARAWLFSCHDKHLRACKGQHTTLAYAHGLAFARNWHSTAHHWTYCLKSCDRLMHPPIKHMSGTNQSCRSAFQQYAREEACSHPREA